MDIKNLSYLMTTTVALLTFIKVVREYIIQGRQKRMELLEKYRNKFHQEDFLKNINPLIEEDSKMLRNINRIERYYYLGFFEELSTLMNSKIIRAEAIHYYFGYYTICTYESKNFWFDINKNSIYWKEFVSFVDKMKKIEQKQRKKHKNIRI